MASQLQQLPTNVTKLMDTVFTLKNKSFLVPPVPKVPIENYLLTPRQIAKKIILVSAGSISAAGQIINQTQSSVNQSITSANMLGADIPPNQSTSPLSNYDQQFANNAAMMIGQIVTPESAHFVVYGKFKRDADGNLIDNEIVDPDCVFTKLAMPSTHPTFNDIQIMVNKVLKTIRLLPIKEKDMLDDIAQSMIAIPASIVSIASAAAILPPGAGIPVAFSAFQGLMANIMNVVSKISELATGVEIENLNYLPLLVEAAKVDAVIGILNAQLIAINTILMTVDGLTKIIPSVPTPPGVGNEPGNPVSVEVSSNINNIPVNVETDVKLKATASNGSWEYIYSWSGPGNFKSTEKEPTIKKLKGTIVGQSLTYTCKVTDKKDSANNTTGTVAIVVA